MRDKFIYDYVLEGMTDKNILMLKPLARDVTLPAFKKFMNEKTPDKMY